MRHHIGLHHPAIDSPAQSGRHNIGQHFGNRIHAFPFVGMRADEHGLPVADQCGQAIWQCIVKDLPNQIEAAPASPLLAAG